MEHTPNDCPNKQLINELSSELKAVKDLYHALDKQTTSDINVIKEQNNTIIRMLTGQTTDYQRLFTAFTELQNKFIINDYQTQKTTGTFEKLGWLAITKVGAIISVAVAVIYALVKGV